MGKKPNEPTADIRRPATDDVKREFARRLRRLLVQKGMNQSDCARAAGLTRDDLSRYTRGKSMPSPVALHKLAKALDVEASDLVPERHGDMEPPEMQIRALADGSVLLTVNMTTTNDVAMEVHRLLYGKSKHRA